MGGGSLDHRGSRPGRRADADGRGLEGLQPPARGAPDPRPACVTAIYDALTRAHRDEWARVVATLAKRFGDLDIAEEMAAEAFATAAERWPRDGIPPNPGAW